MSKYTSGPWYIEGHEVKVNKPEREHLGDGAPETICEMFSSVSPEETRANQVLIAAAPSLLAALSDILNEAERYGFGGNSGAQGTGRVACNQARAAIARVEGGAS